MKGDGVTGQHATATENGNAKNIFDAFEARKNAFFV